MFNASTKPRLLSVPGDSAQGIVEKTPPVENAGQALTDQHDGVICPGATAGFGTNLAGLTLVVERAGPPLIGRPASCASTGRISCHQRMTQSDFEKNR
jgi:hypothetical protein